jgi:uncharacterized protein with GYD domain
VETYIILQRWTDGGISRVDAVSDRETAARRAALEMGGTHHVYFTLGHYDAITIVEAPDAEAVAAYTLEIGTHGNIRTETMRAFSESEFLALASRRPRWSLP